MSDLDFQKLQEILRTGDAEAFDRLLADLEPYLRRVARTYLFDQQARRVVDSTDIVQSLLKDFLANKGTDLAAVSAHKLHAYLTAAARYKIASKVRKERKRQANFEEIAEPESREPSTAQQVEDRDLIDSIRNRLDAESQRLFDLSHQGQTWRQIADQIGGHPDTLRIQLRRSIAAALAEIRNSDQTHET